MRKGPRDLPRTLGPVTECSTFLSFAKRQRQALETARRGLEQGTHPTREAAWVSTNDAAQWALAAMQNLALAPDALPACALGAKPAFVRRVAHEPAHAQRCSRLNIAAHGPTNSWWCHRTARRAGGSRASAGGAGSPSMGPIPPGVGPNVRPAVALI